MALHHWGYIFLSPGFKAGQHETQMNSSTCKVSVAGIDLSEKEKVVEVAKKMVAEGVQMIELCGGFGPEWMSKVSEAIEKKVPIGGVFYGPEARQPLLDILNSK